METNFKESPKNSRKSYKWIVIFGLIGSLLIILGSIVIPKLQGYTDRKNIDQVNRETVKKAQNSPDLDTGSKFGNTTSGKTVFNSSPAISPPPTKNSTYLKVQFICQAPLETIDNWKFHEESCEEAALLQAYLYETGRTMSKQEANELILNMIEWQKANLGGHHDLYAPEMKKFITGYYKLENSEVEIILDAGIEDIRKNVSAGHPVIAPVTGDILKNPYYPYPGYHMLTVIGYTEDRIITNDNGTRRGADFSYDLETFKKALKDAGGDILILNLKKAPPGIKEGP